MIFAKPVSLLTLLFALFFTISGSTPDWPMLGGAPDRNAVSEMQAAPTAWDPAGEENVAWQADLGTQTYATPVVSGGKVFIGTNNGNPRDQQIQDDRGVLMAFNAENGEFLWQATSPKLPTGSVNDWAQVGVCSTPLVEGDRLYYVTNRCELVALDTEGFRDHENDGFQEEPSNREEDADIVWKLDMISQLGVFPHNMSNGSPVSLGDLLYVSTSNGQNEDHTRVPAPAAPSLIAVNKKTGKVVWTDNSPGPNILNGQWSSPAAATIQGVDQVIAAQGDGWVRGFEARTGEKLWEFDTNPKDSIYPQSRNEILATPVMYDQRVYVANGQDPENGEGEGFLYCIDPSGRGDITETGLVWKYTDIRRSISSGVVYEGLLYYPDFSGFFHCLDAQTGQPLWVHDTFAAVWGSPVVVAGKVYLGDEDGDVVVLKAGRREEVISEINMRETIYSTITPADGRLYVATFTRLFALEK